jgi:hypothetical protein
VTFAGNEATAPQVVERYALFRAAELTVEHGYDYFIVIDRALNAQTVTHTGMPKTSSSTDSWTDWTTGARGTTTTSVTTQDIHTGTEHSAMKTIRMFKGAKPADDLQVYDAKSMVEMMGPSIK